MIRLYTQDDGEVKVNPHIEHGRLMIQVGRGYIHLDVQDAKDLIAALQEVLDANG